MNQVRAQSEAIRFRNNFLSYDLYDTSRAIFYSCSGISLLGNKQSYRMFVSMIDSPSSCCCFWLQVARSSGRIGLKRDTNTQGAKGRKEKRREEKKEERKER